jgi:hypothetical protein
VLEEAAIWHACGAGIPVFEDQGGADTKWWFHVVVPKNGTGFL